MALKDPVDLETRVDGGTEWVPSVREATKSDAVAALLGESHAMRELRARVRQVASYSGVSVLLVGESGTGKELVARTLHELSFADAPFVKLDCATLSEAALGAEVGKVANGGTLFLKRVDRASATFHAQLNRLLESRASASATCELAAVRVVSAITSDLATDVDLDPELLQRLAEFTIELPPLCDRRDDIELLAEAFLENFCVRHRIARMLSAGARTTLVRLTWPGNVRQLRAVVEAAAIAIDEDLAIESVHVKECFSRTPRFGPRSDHRPATAEVLPAAGGLPASFPSLRDMERTLILRAWLEQGSNLSRAAKHLGLPRSTLRDKLRKFGVL